MRGEYPVLQDENNRTCAFINGTEESVKLKIERNSASVVDLFLSPGLFVDLHLSFMVCLLTCSYLVYLLTCVFHLVCIVTFNDLDPDEGHCYVRAKWSMVFFCFEKIIYRAFFIKCSLCSSEISTPVQTFQKPQSC